MAGDLPPRPAVLAMSFSALDPAIAPDGKHQITLWSQWHPYALRGGRRWADIAGAETDRILAEMETRSPGFTASVEHCHVQTPADIESELGLLGGNVMHVEMSLDQMFLWRPLPELSGYRVPDAPGPVYLTGGLHPSRRWCLRCERTQRRPGRPPRRQGILVDRVKDGCRGDRHPRPRTAPAGPSADDPSDRPGRRRGPRPDRLPPHCG